MMENIEPAHEGSSSPHDVSEPKNDDSQLSILPKIPRERPVIPIMYPDIIVKEIQIDDKEEKEYISQVVRQTRRKEN